MLKDLSNYCKHLISANLESQLLHRSSYRRLLKLDEIEVEKVVTSIVDKVMREIPKEAKLAEA